jgi:hypothetical protein
MGKIDAETWRHRISAGPTRENREHKIEEHCFAAGNGCLLHSNTSQLLTTFKVLVVD